MSLTNSAERFTSARTPSARALGAPTFMEGEYTGAELGRTCLRPGAYDAYDLPSLATGKSPRAALVYPTRTVPQALERARVATWAPLPEPACTEPEPEQVTSTRPTIYQPRRNSVAARVVAALKAEGGYLTHAQIEARFGIARTSIPNSFDAALRAGLLVRHVLPSRQVAFALPGHTPEEPRP
jgi:hypothetical protein